MAGLGDDDSHVSIAVGTRTFATASLAFCLKFSHLDGVDMSSHLSEFGFFSVGMVMREDDKYFFGRFYVIYKLIIGCKKSRFLYCFLLFFLDDGNGQPHLYPPQLVE